MVFDLTLRDIELSTSDQQLIEKKISRRVQKLPKLPRVKVSLGYNARRNTAHALCRFLVDGAEFLGSGENSNMLVALDEALSKVDRQTTRLSGKMQSRRQAGGIRTYEYQY